MLKIKNAEDFGLAFNSMTRLYMASHEEEILDDMHLVCQEYLMWFSLRTIVCSLRDLVEDHGWSRSERAVPKEQKERYEELIEILTRQGIAKERENSRYKDEKLQVMSFMDVVGFQDSIYGKKRKWTNEDVYQWIFEKNLTENVEIKKIGKKEELPLKKKNIPLFYKVCNYMIHYSYGRHTYMPGTCRDFVKENIINFTDEALRQILSKLTEWNALLPDDEPIINKIDSDTWRNMQEELEQELIAREYYNCAEEHNKLYSDLDKWLNEIFDYDLLVSQKDCRQMYHKIIGVERYLKSCNENLRNVRYIYEMLEVSKKKIAEKLWYFFEKEEGDKYEKVADGVYQRKNKS